MELSSCCLFGVTAHMVSKLKLLAILFLFHVVAAKSHNSLHPSCHGEEMSALLQFKDSFSINRSASRYGAAYPKVSSWNGGSGNTDNSSSCCSWDGIECDAKTGNVISLDLSSSCLYGSISSTSTLFNLVHLKTLNLADNHFNYSQIPSSIRNFPSLTYLNLSGSVFSGRVPSQVSQLSKLSFLDLSLNVDIFSTENELQPLLKLNASDFGSILQNLTSLELLYLSYVNISSTIPHSIANLSSLTFLALRNCELFGEFPVRVFKLPNLKLLSVRYNQDLTGYLPELNRTSPLVLLKISFTGFYKSLPSSIGNLGSLQELDVAACNFSKGLIPPSLGNLQKLTYLDISKSQFGGQIPDSLSNLTQLTVFRIGTSALTGPIPSWIGTFSKLVYLDFAYNGLNGSIPTSFSNLTNLEILFLQSNSLSGVVKFQMFQNLPNINQLQLNYNNLEFVTDSKSTKNSTVVPQFTNVGLAECKIKEFPFFLQYQNMLERLDLSINIIQGKVPKWMWNISIGTLKFLDISQNHISDQLPAVLPWVTLFILRLSSNLFHGSLPLPPPSMLEFTVTNNNFTGEVSPLLCNMISLQYLDLSKNYLSGKLPQCLGNFSDNLSLLLLGNNNFHGIVPQTYSTKSSLRMIDMSHNQLEGELPRSLANCLMLEYLVLSNNQFNDVFPIWLGRLVELKLLAMRHNRFHGLIGKSRKNVDFMKLRILDLSYNNFTGEIPSLFPDIIVNKSAYMSTDLNYEVNDFVVENIVPYSITLATKGLELYYPKIQEAFASFDISSNKFEGEIPMFIGNLKGLRSLNLSNNILTGSIPLSLGNLSVLESLDLSQNKLSGSIPQQLTHLSFLARFSVAHNNLTGPIPQGTQLTSFNTTSYEGNRGLCGNPLPKCGNSKSPQLPPSSTVGENDFLEFVWIFALTGVVSGFVVGVVLSDVVITKRHELFYKNVELIRQVIGKN